MGPVGIFQKAVVSIADFPPYLAKTNCHIWSQYSPVHISAEINDASYEPHFPAPPILYIFSWQFYGLVLGLVELIDAKGIGVAQPI